MGLKQKGLPVSGRMMWGLILAPYLYDKSQQKFLELLE